MPLKLAQIHARLENLREGLSQSPKAIGEGRLKRVSGLVMEVEGLPMSIGGRACVRSAFGDALIEAECIGFNGGITYLMAIDSMAGVSPGVPVYSANVPFKTIEGYTIRSSIEPLAIDDHLLGRIVDGFGRPLDGKGEGKTRPLPYFARSMNPLLRTPIAQPMDAGIRSVNAMLTVGRGQRIGIFAGSGVGKSVMLGMLARNCQADVIVIALVGERGREVREFCEDTLGEQALARSVVVAAPADASPLARAKGAWYASDIACWFRDQGRHVVLIVDSLTRFAMAQREIGLSLGEAPVSRGYPPSVFGKMPELVEKAGNGSNPDGSITAFYTVLLEGDDINDPVADTARGILDGHFFLSRELADAGHYPAVDIEKSISRAMPRVAEEKHLMAARRFKQLYSRYMRGRDLLMMGAYVPGSDPDMDAAVKAWPVMQAFLQQHAEEQVDMAESLAGLYEVMGVPA